MPTFAGSYIKEPQDVRVAACTEADLIIAYGEGVVDVRSGAAKTFDALTNDQKTVIVGRINEVIATVEDELNSYARKRGYATPLSPVDAQIVKLAARMFWVDVQQGAKKINADAAETQRRHFRDGQLRDIASGTLLLTAAKNASASVPPPSSHVYSITDATSRSPIDSPSPLLNRAELDRVF